MALLCPRGVSSGSRKCVWLPSRLSWCTRHQRYVPGRANNGAWGFWCPPLGSLGGVLGPGRRFLHARRMFQACCGRKDSSEMGSGKMSDDMIAWLKSGSRGEESTESEIKAWAEPIASVADIDQDPNIVDSDDEFVIDEIVVDEIDDFELVQEPTPPMSTFQHQPESQAVPERSIAEPPIGIEEPPVASQGSFQWKSILFGAALLFVFQCIWKGLTSNGRKQQPKQPNSDTRPTGIQQSLESLKSLPFGVQATQESEPVEWVNMCWRKAWRVYQRGLERWLSGLLQPLFDNLVAKGKVPTFVLRLRILDLTFDHEAPCFSNMRRRPSRKDSDLNGVVDVRYTGGARMLLMLEVGGGQWRLQVPVLVSDLDIECRLWVKIRLAPLSPYLGTISLAFVAPPNIKVQLSPYNSVRLMRVPVLQNFLKKFLTEDLPGLMVLPKRLEINIPPAVTAVAEAAVGRDAVMRAVASAVLQADVVEQSLTSALPLGPQGAAGGISVPDSFQGELSVTLVEGRNLPVWGFPWQSNPYCRLTLGRQAVLSKRESDTSCEGSHGNPIWNQEFEFLIEDTERQVLEIFVKDSHITGRPEVGKVEFPLRRGVSDNTLNVWLPLQSVNPGQSASGELRLELTYKPFLDDDEDSGFREAEAYARKRNDITDVKSAAAASSKAAVAASAAFAAVAMTKAAAARAAHKAHQAANAAKKIASLGSYDSDDEDEEFVEAVTFDPDTYDELDMSGRRMQESFVSNDYEDDDDFSEEDDGEDEEDKPFIDNVDVDGDDDDYDNDNGWEEPREREEYKPAVELEDSELEGVLAEVKADLGEDIGNVIATEELASQLQILTTRSMSDGMDGNAARSDTLRKAKLQESVLLDGVDPSGQNGLVNIEHDSKEQTSEILQLDGFWDGSNFDLPVAAHPEGHVSDFDDQEATEMDISGPVTGNIDEAVTDLEPAEALVLPPPGRIDMGLSQGNTAGSGPEMDEKASNLSAEDLLKNVASSVSALETKLDAVIPEQPFGLSETRENPHVHVRESPAAGAWGSDEETKQGPSAGKKRKRQEDTEPKGQWYAFLWPWGKQHANSDADEIKTSEPHSNQPEARVEGSSEGFGPLTQQGNDEKVPWWVVLASAVSFRRGRLDSEEKERPRKRPKSQKEPKKRRKDISGPRLVVPPVDMAAIARELVRMREEKSKSKDDKVDSPKSQSTDGADQQWVVLLCILTACSAGLLSVVAYRLDHFG